MNSILNDLSYKSPTEFGKEAADIVSVNLLECSAYHQYIEMKATRDVFVHNDGVANEIYVRKAGSHARVRSGVALPINQVYFLECYESCLVHPVNGEVPSVKGRPWKLPHCANPGKTTGSGGELASARSCFSTVRTALGKL